MAKNKKPSTATPSAAATTVAPPEMQNYPAFQPGHLAALAQQMNAGYGGDQATAEGILSSMYRSVNVPMINRPGQIEPYLKQQGITPVSAAAAIPTSTNRRRNRPAPKPVPIQQSGPFRSV